MKEVYQVLSGMLGQEQRIAQIANNLANINTVGFKKDSASFEDHLAQAANETAVNANSAAPRAFSSGENSAAWPQLGGAYVDFTTGSLQTTGRTLDVAVEGDGFFEVKSKDSQETRYTRAGNFTLGPSGALQTIDGSAVLNENGGEITVDPKAGPLQITNDGMIRQAGVDVARLGVATFQDPQRLQKVGNAMFQAPAGVSAQPVTTVRVKPGTLEGSNVNAIREMVDMIEMQRAYDVNQKAIQSIDDITQKRISAAS